MDMGMGMGMGMGMDGHGHGHGGMGMGMGNREKRVLVFRRCRPQYISARASTDTGSERWGGCRMGAPASLCHNSDGDGTQSLQPNLA